MRYIDNAPTLPRSGKIRDDNFWAGFLGKSCPCPKPKFQIPNTKF